MNEILCHCAVPAKYLCEAHKSYFCSSHAASHLCSTIIAEKYIKAVRLEKATYYSSLKIVKTENKQIVEELFKNVRISIKKLKEAKKTINISIDNLIASTSKTIEGVISSEFTSRLEYVEEKLRMYEQNKKYVEMKKYMSRNKCGKLRKKLRAKGAQMSKLVDQEYLLKEVKTFIDKLKEEISSVAECMHSLNFDVSDKGERESYIHENFVDVILQVNNSYFTNFKKDLQSLPDVVDQPDKRGLVGAPGINMHERMKMKSLGYNPAPRYKRGTELIESTIPMKRNTVNVYKYMQQANTIEENINLEDLALEESLIEDDTLYQTESLNSIDYHLKSVAEIEEKYICAKERCQKLIEKTYEKFQDRDFFDTSHKSEVNAYIKNFNDRFQDASKELLLNFNKL